MAEVLHYPGDQRRFDPDWILGPDSDRRYMLIKSATYNPQADVTTCAMRAVMPDEFRERVLAMADRERDRERIRALFSP